MKNIPIVDERITLWKYVDKNGCDFKTGKINYLLENEDIIDPEWNVDFKGECGYALHLADTPSAARSFHSEEDGILLKVSANIKDCVCFGGNPDYPQKIRARACRNEGQYPIDYEPDFE